MAYEMDVWSIEELVDRLSEFRGQAHTVRHELEQTQDPVRAALRFNRLLERCSSWLRATLSRGEAFGLETQCAAAKGTVSIARIATLVSGFDRYLATLQDDIGEDPDHWEEVLFSSEDDEDDEGADDDDDTRATRNAIFLAHGRGKAWKAVEAFLSDEGLDVQAFETEPRAGKHIVEVLQRLLSTSSLAIVILTGDDATPDGGTRARQNVVHEAGLFQGHLGFHRAILLVEEGVEEFSNIAGLQQIRFPRGSVTQSLPELRRVLVREGLVAR